MKGVLTILLILIIISGFSCSPKQESKITTISITQIHDVVIGKDVQLIDVRTAKEYQKGHIDDAENIDFMQEDHFKSSISKYDKKQPIYIYCQAGIRSGKAAKLLDEMGFEKIFDFSGGYKEWSNQ